MNRSEPIEVPVRLKFEGITGAAVVERGDYLVLSFRTLTSNMAAHIRAGLREHCPDLADRLLLVEAEAMAVIRHDPGPPSGD